MLIFIQTLICSIVPMAVIYYSSLTFMLFFKHMINFENGLRSK